MLDLLRHWVAFKFDRRGVTALEYAIIAGVLGTAIVAGVGVLAPKLQGVFTTISGDL